MNSAILCGCDSVLPSAYGGWDGRLGMEGAIHDIEHAAEWAHRYNPKVLWNNDLTPSNYMEYICRAARDAKPTDTIFIDWSCHGSQEKDTDGDEIDGIEEMGCFYTGKFNPDEHAAFFRLAECRVVFVIDCCYPAGMMRGNTWTPLKVKNPAGIVTRSIPRNTHCPVILLAAARENEPSEGLKSGGAWHNSLHSVYRKGHVPLSWWEKFLGKPKKELRYKNWFNAAKSRPLSQHPVWVEQGPVTNAFRNDLLFR